MDNRRVVPWITKGSNVITTVTQGVTPPGPRGKKKNVAPLSFFLSTLIVTVLVTKNFLLEMSTSDSIPSISHWDIFIRNPKGCSDKVVQGAHKFLSDVINGTEQSPTNSVFMNLFDQFTTTPVKKYVYQRMTRKILQELALRMLQEIISGGPTRAKSLQLELEEPD